jgi:hypothetical protein
METTTKNKFFAILDIDKCRQIIDRTPSDAIAILCPNYSINIQAEYYRDETIDPEQIDWDFDEFEEKVGHTLFVNDFDDLCADPHNVYNP